jgi:hypothetical protein
MKLKSTYKKIYWLSALLLVLLALMLSSFLIPQKHEFELLPIERSAEQYIPKPDQYNKIHQIDLHHKTKDGIFYNSTLRVYEVSNKEMKFYAIDIDEQTVYYQFGKPKGAFFFCGVTKNGIYHPPAQSAQLNEKLYDHPINTNAREYIVHKKL